MIVVTTTAATAAAAKVVSTQSGPAQWVRTETGAEATGGRSVDERACLSLSLSMWCTIIGVPCRGRK